MPLGLIGDTQAGTATAGPIVFNDIVGVAGADLADKDHAVNQTLISGKKKGSVVFNSTTGELVVAQGSTDVATWVNAGAVAAVITPA